MFGTLSEPLPHILTPYACEFGRPARAGHGAPYILTCLCLHPHLIGTRLPTVQGITLLLMLVTSLGSTLFWALGASMVFVAAHAVTHKTEFHQVDGSDFGSGPPPADQV